MFISRFVPILGLSIFGRPAVDFFLEKAAKASAVPLCMTFRCESFCSCEFEFCFDFDLNFVFVDFWPPCCGICLRERREGIDRAIMHDFLMRILLQFRIQVYFRI